MLFQLTYSYHKRSSIIQGLLDHTLRDGYSKRKGISMSKSKVQSMTTGSPLRLILVFMIPLLLGNLFQQFYNIVDAMIVGRLLGADALAAVGSSSSVQFLVLGFCMGSCAGFGIPVSQRFGAEDFEGLRRYVYHSLLVTAVIAVVLTTLTAWLCPFIMHIMQTPDNIYQDAYQYLLILFLGIPFTLLYNLLSSLLRAVGNSKAPFIFLAVSTFLNIFLDLFCIAVLKLGCAGAALATITAQALSGLACLVYIHRCMPVLKPRREDCRWNGTIARSLVVMGVPMGLQYSITAIGSMVMQSANNGLGSIYVSGFTAGTKVKQFMLSPFDAVATAMATFVGQNMGAHQMDRVRQGIRLTLEVAIGYGIIAGLFMNVGGHFLASLFVSASNASVIDAAAQYMGALGTLYWLLAILDVTRYGIQSLGFSALSVISGALEMVARILVATIFVPLFGFHAICWTDQAAWVAACCYLIPMLLHLIHKVEREYKEKE